MNIIFKANTLPAPLVTAADPLDGLLQVIDLDRPIAVDVPIWVDARDGDLIQLKWDNVPIGLPHSITNDEKPGDIVTLPLNPEHLNEGNHQLGIIATNPFNQSTHHSETTAIKIDRTPPGAALLAPMMFPNATFGDFLAGLIPGYAGMEPGDTIQAVCNEMNGPTTTVAPEHLTTSPINIKFEREFLSNLQSDEITVYYQVTDRAGNVSAPSNASSLTLTI